MTLPQRVIEVTYSYTDYLHWDDQEGWELINGEVWNMSPVPSRLHQEISIRLSSFLYQHFRGKDCAVYAADQTVMAYFLGEKGEYGKAEILTPKDQLFSKLSAGLAIELAEVFPAS